MHKTGDFPHAESAATRMLAAGMHSTAARENVSMRDLARRLGYKQSVVLSHMASGRVPIPIDRAPEFAQLLQLDQNEFLLAVLEQRHPSIGFRALLQAVGTDEPKHNEIVEDLEAIAGGALSSLSDGQLRVLREVVADANAPRRWLSVHEVPLVELVRVLRVRFSTDGLTVGDRRAISGALGKAAS